MKCDNCCEPIVHEVVQPFAGLELCLSCRKEEYIRRAAPDLLAALEIAIAVWEMAETKKTIGKSKLGSPPIWILDAYTAISKAKGAEVQP